MIGVSCNGARLSQEFPVKPEEYLSEPNRGEEDDSKMSSLEIGRHRRASFHDLKKFTEKSGEYRLAK